MKQIIKVQSRPIAQLVKDEGVVEALVRVKANERLSFIDEGAVIGENTEIYYFVQIYGPAKIGKNCLLGSHITIQGEGTKIGNNVRIGDFSFIPAGTIIEDDVFISQHCSLTNDKYPKSGNKDWKKEPVTIKKGASIGSGSVLLPGIVIGENAVVGAGSVVVESVPDNGKVVGYKATSNSFNQNVREIIALVEKDDDLTNSILERLKNEYRNNENKSLALNQNYAANGPQI